MATAKTSGKISVRAKIICPHCWRESDSPDLVWVATNAGEEKDAKVEDQPPRFQASSFNLAGNARGPYGGISTELACPACHLEIPRAMLAQPTYFFSIFGIRSSGKSFFLTSMTKRLEEVLSKEFKMAFLMVFSRFNQRLEDLQKMLFNARRPHELTRLPKNQKVGDFYSTVKLDGRGVDYPIPFLYQLSPIEGHEDYQKATAPSGVFVLYDNAGEDFEQRVHSETRPVTEHLITASVVFVVIDPFQFPSFRNACLRAGCKLPGESGELNQVPTSREKGAPVLDASIGDADLHNSLQDQARRLGDTMARIRAQMNRGALEREVRPICVVVTKYDAWRDLMSSFNPRPWNSDAPGQPAVLDTQEIQRVSDELHDLLQTHATELVATLETYADSRHVYYFPVSATGCKTERMSDGGYGVRPADIAPIWSEVPMLFALHKWLGNYIPGNG